MREIDQVRITLLRMFRGAVQLPQEIIDEMLKPFLHTRNAAIKVQAITKGYLVRFNLVKHYHRNQIALNNSNHRRNQNMMTARLRYRDASGCLHVLHPYKHDDGPFAGKYRETYHATRYF